MEVSLGIYMCSSTGLCKEMTATEPQALPFLAPLPPSGLQLQRGLGVESRLQDQHTWVNPTSASQLQPRSLGTPPDFPVPLIPPFKNGDK